MLGACILMFGGFWRGVVVADKGEGGRTEVGALTSCRRVVVLRDFRGRVSSDFNRLKSSCGAADSRGLGRVGAGALGVGGNPLMVVGKA